VQIDPHVTLFRYSDVPGMVGRVGTALGEAGINILSAAVGHRPGETDGREAVMVLTTDAPVPPEVLGRIVATDGFVDGRTLSLQ
jgi:D-3-phosphoglycerate dehydrogenase